MPRTSPIPGKLKYPSPLPPWKFFLDPRELILSMLRSAMWPIGLMFLMQWLIVYLVQFMTFFESYLYFTSSVDPYKSTLKSIEINAIGGTLKSRRWHEWIRFGFIVVLCFECFNLLYLYWTFCGICNWYQVFGAVINLSIFFLRKILKWWCFKPQLKNRLYNFAIFIVHIRDIMLIKQKMIKNYEPTKIPQYGTNCIPSILMS